MRESGGGFGLPCVVSATMLEVTVVVVTMPAGVFYIWRVDDITLDV